MTIGSKESWGFDSNTIVYILDNKSPFHKKTAILFEILLGKRTQFFITQQNILETERVLISFYKLQAKKAVEKTEEFLEAFNFSILIPLPSTLFRYHEVLKKVGKYPLDVYLAATYLDNGINQIFTANEKDFVGISKFKAVNPYKKGF